jgi:hypothetical protein
VTDPHAEPMRQIDICRLYERHYFCSAEAGALTAGAGAGAGADTGTEGPPMSTPSPACGERAAGFATSSHVAAATGGGISLEASRKRARADPSDLGTGAVETMIRDAGDAGVSVEQIGIHFGVSRGHVAPMLDELFAEGAVYRSPVGKIVAL